MTSLISLMSLIKMVQLKNCSENDRLPWYILKTKPRSEEIARNLLTQYGLEVYLPQTLYSTRPKRELKPIPLFPGYLFFRLETDSSFWARLKWTTGVSYVLSADSGPLVVPAELIEEIKQRQAYHQKRMLEEITRPFEAGEKLRVVTGPFEGLEAIFDRKLSSAGRCQVLLNILGQLSRVQMEKTDLERIGLHQ